MHFFVSHYFQSKIRYCQSKKATQNVYRVQDIRSHIEILFQSFHGLGHKHHQTLIFNLSYPKLVPFLLRPHHNLLDARTPLVCHEHQSKMKEIIHQNTKVSMLHKHTKTHKDAKVRIHTGFHLFREIGQIFIPGYPVCQRLF